MILNGEEKIGGLPVVNVDSDDFKTCIESCDLIQIPYKGSLLTWWNGRAGNDCFFERLDSLIP